ncbi:glyoxalase superfamily protein [Aquibium sp. LZ166]|uniref:Glyoxalase superfamily protein n=1 Tax=Aquibium pacificus TaxID=3153579 RepID=A0ABV3SG26_9HYPH
MTIVQTFENPVETYKAQARRLREALSADGVAVSHGRALELVARQNGVRDWNTLSAQAAVASAPEKADGPAAPFAVGDRVEGTFNGKPVQGHVFGLEETIKPHLWRATIAFDPPVDVVTSELFSSTRRRITMVVGADGRSRRLTGTETGVMAVRRV